MDRRNPGDSAEAGDRSGVFDIYSTAGDGYVNGTAYLTYIEREGGVVPHIV